MLKNALNIVVVCQCRRWDCITGEATEVYALEINWIIIAPVWGTVNSTWSPPGAPYSSSSRQNANDCASRSSRVCATSTVLNLSPAPPRANSMTSPTTLSVRSENSPPLRELTVMLSHYSVSGKFVLRERLKRTWTGLNFLLLGNPIGAYIPSRKPVTASWIPRTPSHLKINDHTQRKLRHQQLRCSDILSNYVCDSDVSTYVITRNVQA